MRARRAVTAGVLILVLLFVPAASSAETAAPGSGESAVQQIDAAPIAATRDTASSGALVRLAGVILIAGFAVAFGLRRSLAEEHA